VSIAQGLVSVDETSVASVGEPHVASPPVALYIHVPFCVSVCPYCDFVVVAGSASRGPRNRIAAFLAALTAELGLRADALDARFGPVQWSAGELERLSGASPAASARPPLDSVYFGGGTPSLLPSDSIAELLDLVARRYGLAPGAEVTVEANPGPDERGDPVGQRRAGATRISFGAQSLHAHELQRLGRRHAPADVMNAVAAARSAGIRSVSLDLLYDVPGQTLDSWRRTIDSAIELGPDHLSLYALTLDDPEAEGLTGPVGDHLPTSAGARRWRTQATPEQDDDRAADEYLYAVDRLARAGWHSYEISNWAKPGHESRHNMAYWTRRPYEAVGPGAHAFDGVTRRWNAARLDGYVNALTPGDGRQPVLPPGGHETLNAETAEREGLILGLRTDRGIDPPGAGRAGATARSAAGSVVSVLDWAIVNELAWVGGDGRLRLTQRGRLLSNEIFARIV
jgi:oxygen-independent coproporphyrinogen-3 oxidase